MQELYYGDVGGVFLDRPVELSKEMQTKRATVNRHWMGVRENHLYLCAKRAILNHEAPGVIVFAMGEDRAEMLREANRRGILSRMVIDQELAEALVSGQPKLPAE